MKSNPNPNPRAYLDGEVLSGLEGGEEGFAVLGLEVEGGDLGGLHDLLADEEVSVASPAAGHLGSGHANL